MEMKDKTVNLKSKRIKLSPRSFQVLEYVADHPKISTSSVLSHFRGLGVRETNAEVEAILNKLYQAGCVQLVNNLWIVGGKLEAY